MQFYVVAKSQTTEVTFTAQFPTVDASIDWVRQLPARLELVSTDPETEDYFQSEWESDVVYCSICDGIGHGQPGYGPCPLEDRGWMDTAEEEARTFGAWNR